MIVRTRCLTSKRCATKSRVSAANSSAFDGGLASRMSSTASTSPRPMKFFQTRLTSDPREERIVRRDQPVGEELPRGPSPDASSGSAGPSSGRGASGTLKPRMVDLPGARRIDDDVAAIGAVLDGDPREQVRHLVVVLLRPLLERMVVAARAGDREPHEGHRHVFGERRSGSCAARSSWPRRSRACCPTR